MKAIIKNDQEVNITHLKVKAGARYWEDAYVNGVSDEEGTLIPFRDGDYWCPTINLEKGLIENWPEGIKADIHYKVCDDGEYWLVTDNGIDIKYGGYYVPEILDLYNHSYGDYIILKIDSDRNIADWKVPSQRQISDFLNCNK